MSKTVKKFTQKPGIITSLDLLEERIKAENMLKVQKAKKKGRMIKISSTPNTWIEERI